MKQHKCHKRHKRHCEQGEVQWLKSKITSFCQIVIVDDESDVCDVSDMTKRGES